MSLWRNTVKSTTSSQSSSEPLRIAAWLKANAKHMGNPQEMDMMYRASIVMEKMYYELQKSKADRGGS